MNYANYTYEKDFVKPSANMDITWYELEHTWMHDHDYWEFFVVTEGKMLHNLNGETFQIEVGDSFLIRPQDIHNFKFVDKLGCKSIFLKITIPQLRQLCQNIRASVYEKMLNLPSPLFLKLNSEAYLHIIRTTDKISILNENNDTEKFTLIQFLFLYVFQLYYESVLFTNSEVPNYLNNFLNKLNTKENLTKSFDEIVALSNYSHSQLARLFKQHTGCTLKSYIVNRKLEYAAQLLAMTNFPILYISESLNYDSLSHFLHIFKQKYKCTPTEFRKKLKSRPPDGPEAEVPNEISKDSRPSD